jgi:hypothetical protein
VGVGLGVREGVSAWLLPLRGGGGGIVSTLSPAKALSTLSPAKALSTLSPAKASQSSSLSGDGLLAVASTTAGAGAGAGFGGSAFTGAGAGAYEHSTHGAGQDPLNILLSVLRRLCSKLRTYRYRGRGRGGLGGCDGGAGRRCWHWHHQRPRAGDDGRRAVNRSNNVSQSGRRQLRKFIMIRHLGFAGAAPLAPPAPPGVEGAEPPAGPPGGLKANCRRAGGFRHRDGGSCHHRYDHKLVSIFLFIVVSGLSSSS